MTWVMGLSKISPIMFEGDIFQTPKNKTQEAALTLTPRKNRDSSINKTSPVKQLQRHEEQPSLDYMMQNGQSQGMEEHSL